MADQNKLTGIFGKCVNHVENIHKSIAKIPFETLEKIEPIQSEVKKVRSVHDSIVDKVYQALQPDDNHLKNEISQEK